MSELATRIRDFFGGPRRREPAPTQVRLADTLERMAAIARTRVKLAPSQSIVGFVRLEAEISGQGRFSHTVTVAPVVQTQRETQAYLDIAGPEGAGYGVSPADGGGFELSTSCLPYPPDQQEPPLTYMRLEPMVTERGQLSAGNFRFQRPLGDGKLLKARAVVVFLHDSAVDNSPGQDSLNLVSDLFRTPLPIREEHFRQVG